MTTHLSTGKFYGYPVATTLINHDGNPYTGTRYAVVSPDGSFVQTKAGKTRLFASLSFAKSHAWDLQRTQN